MSITLKTGPAGHWKDVPFTDMLQPVARSAWLVTGIQTVSRSPGVSRHDTRRPRGHRPGSAVSPVVAAFGTAVMHFSP